MSRCRSSPQLLRLTSCQANEAVSHGVVCNVQIRPDDAFGRQMLMNLEVSCMQGCQRCSQASTDYTHSIVSFMEQARGCPLKGIRATPDLAAHMRRFTGNGWQRAAARDMSAIYRACLDPAEKRRWGPCLRT